MRREGRSPVTIPRPRGTRRIEFGPIRIDLRLEVGGVPKVLSDERPFIEGAMAPFDPAIAFRGMARDADWLDPQADPPEGQVRGKRGGIGVHKDRGVIGLNGIGQAPLGKGDPTIRLHLLGGQLNDAVIGARRGVNLMQHGAQPTRSRA